MFRSPTDISVRHDRPSRRRRSAAFTLVESVIAIGIVSFAMLSILGLIPVGLGTFRQAMSLTVEASIVQAVSGQLMRADYTNLASSSSTNMYFDQEGNRVAESDKQRLYVARILQSEALDAGDDLVSSNAARKVPIQISSSTHPGTTNSYFVIVPRSR